MRAADRVETCLFQQPDAPVLRGPMGGRAEHAVVVMNARTTQQDRVAVDLQPMTGVDGDGPQTHPFAPFVNDNALNLEPGGKFIKMGSVSGPGLWFLDAHDHRSCAAGAA